MHVGGLDCVRHRLLIHNVLLLLLLLLRRYLVRWNDGRLWNVVRRRLLLLVDYVADWLALFPLWLLLLLLCWWWGTWEWLGCHRDLLLPWLHRLLHVADLRRGHGLYHHCRGWLAASDGMDWHIGL